MRTLKTATTDVSVVIRIIDSTDGTPETGVVWNTAGIDLEYRREGAVSVDIVEATLADLTAAHTDGGFLHIGNGFYRLDLPDAACAAGVTGVLIHGTVTGMVVIGEYIQLVAYDPADAVRLGLTSLPNAAADAAGGMPISDAGGLDLDAKLANTNEVTAARMGALTDLIDGGRLDLLVDGIKTKTDYLPSATAGAAGGVFIAGANAATTVDITGSLSGSVGSVTGHTPQTGDNYVRLGAPAGASMSVDIAAVKTDTGNLVSRITATLFSGITSFAEWIGLLAGKQSGNATARTELRATGAGAGTYDETIDSLEAVRDRGDTAWVTATSVTVSDKTGFSLAADQSAVTIGTVTTLTGHTAQSGDTYALAAGATGFTAIDTVVDAILVDTAEIGAAGAGLTAVPWNASWDAEVQSECADALTAYDPPTNAEMEARTLLAASYATAANQTTIAAYLDTEVAAILEDTGTTLPAQIAALNNLSAAQVNAEVVDVLTVDTPVDGKTLAVGVAIVAAGVLGKLSGAGTGTETVLGLDGVTSRAIVTVDASGNRTAVTY